MAGAERRSPSIKATVSSLAVSLVLRARGPEGVKEIFKRVGLERIRPLLAEPDLWISYEETMAAVEAAASICDEDDIGYQLGEEAARIMFEQGRLDPFRGRPLSETLSVLVELLNSGNELRELRVDVMSETEARIESRPLTSTQDRFLCRFGTGFLTAVPGYLGRTGVASETQCTCRGASICRFEVRWQPPRSVVAVAATSPAEHAPAIEVAEQDMNVKDESVLSAILKRVIDGLPLPRHVVGVRVSLTSEESGHPVTYSRGGTESPTGASYTASISGTPGMQGTATIVFAGRGLPGVDQLLAESCAEQIGKILSDVTSQSALRDQARRDPLTGLANRAKLEELAPAITEGTAVVFLDLNGFKAVNDELGHLAGDALLTQLGDRLQHTVRSTDLVARFGGDEFVAMVNATQSVDDAASVASKLLGVFSEPFDLDGHHVTLSASCGIARAPEDGSTFPELVATADGRMYQDKRLHRYG